MSFSTGLFLQGRGYVSLDLKFADEKIGRLVVRCKAADRPAAKSQLRVMAADPKVCDEKLRAFIAEISRILAKIAKELLVIERMKEAAR